MELMHGAPADMAGREDKEIRSYELLDSLGIEYDRVDHEAANTIDACVEVDAVLGTEICKNLFLCNRQKTAFYLLVMPGEKSFHTRELSDQLGVARLSFADAEHMEAFLDVKPGSVTIMGLANDKESRVRLVIDEDVLAQPYFACHPCVNTSSLKFTTRDLTEKLIPAMGHAPTVVHLASEEQ